MHTDTPRTQPGTTRRPVVIDVPAASEPAPAAEPAPGRSVSRALVGIGMWIVLGLAVAVLATVTLGPRLGLFQVETVLSGSMEPLFRPGDLLVVVPEPLTDVRPGQILSFHAPTPDHRVETHRVVRVIHPGAHPIIITKGDANSAPDPWRARLARHDRLADGGRGARAPARRSARSGSPGCTSSPSSSCRSCSPPRRCGRSGARPAAARRD